MKEDEEVLKLIEESAQKFGRINLSSGNCGQFSLALAKKLIDKGINATIGVLHKYDSDVTDLQELACEEVPIYHVVVTIEDKIFDSTGKITTQDLVDFSIREYRDDEPSYIKNINVEELALHTIINFETNWSINAETFYEFLNNIENKKHVKKLKP